MFFEPDVLVRNAKRAALIGVPILAVGLCGCAGPDTGPTPAEASSEQLVVGEIAVGASAGIEISPPGLYPYVALTDDGTKLSLVLFGACDLPDGVVAYSLTDEGVMTFDYESRAGGCDLVAGPVAVELDAENAISPSDQAIVNGVEATVVRT